MPLCKICNYECEEGISTCHSCGDGPFCLDHLQEHEETCLPDLEDDDWDDDGDSDAPINDDEELPGDYDPEIDMPRV